MRGALRFDGRIPGVESGSQYGDRVIALCGLVGGWLDRVLPFASAVGDLQTPASSSSPILEASLLFPSHPLQGESPPKLAVDHIVLLCCLSLWACACHVKWDPSMATINILFFKPPFTDTVPGTRNRSDQIFCMIELLNTSFFLFGGIQYFTFLKCLCCEVMSWRE